MWMKQEWHLCKLHNEVFKAAESRINTECLPFVGRDESNSALLGNEDWIVCPSYEGMNRYGSKERMSAKSLPFVGGDES